MTEHVLLRLANRFPAREPDPVVGWLYNRDIGAWVDLADPSTLYAYEIVNVGQTGPKPSPGTPKPPPQPVPKPRPPMSKKADLETGEDMKGA
jgi:hypothetical protein